MDRHSLTLHWPRRVTSFPCETSTYTYSMSGTPAPPLCPELLRCGWGPRGSDGDPRVSGGGLWDSDGGPWPTNLRVSPGRGYRRGCESPTPKLRDRVELLLQRVLEPPVLVVVLPLRHPVQRPPEVVLLPVRVTVGVLGRTPSVVLGVVQVGGPSPSAPVTEETSWVG